MITNVVILLFIVKVHSSKILLTFFACGFTSIYFTICGGHSNVTVIQILNIFFSKDNVVDNSNLSPYQIFRQW